MGIGFAVHGWPKLFSAAGHEAFVGTLGALGVLLARPNRRGLLGIALGAGALLMGGPQAEPPELGAPRAVAAGLEYFVRELLALALVVVPPNLPGHLGLASMEERARLTGGWWTIAPAPGTGTTVEFWVPMNHPDLSSDVP